MSISFRPFEIYRVDNGKYLKTIEKKIILPAELSALFFPAMKPDKAEIFQAGDTIKISDGKIHWFLNHPFEVNFNISNLTSSDGYKSELSTRLKFQINAQQADALDDFIKVIPQGRNQLFIADIEQYFGAELRNVVKDYTQQQQIRNLVETDVTATFDPICHKGLNRLLLNSGIEFMGSTSIIFSSQEFQTLKNKDAEIQKNAEFEDQKAKIRAIWDKVKHDEALSKFEFEQFLSELKNNQIIQDLKHEKEQLEVKQELDEAYVNYKKHEFDMQKTLEELELNKKLKLDRIKFIERLEQAKIALNELDGASTEFFISLIEDENLRAKLYEELIMHKMTPEQIKMYKMPDLDKRIDEKLSEFNKKIIHEIEKGLGKMQSAGVKIKNKFASGTAKFPAQKAKRILLPVRRKVLSYKPGDYRDASKPYEVYDFQKFELGSIRSVRVQKHQNRDFLLAGARKGLYLTQLVDADKHETQKKVDSYALYTDKNFEGGVNSSVIFGNFIWCTHSEAGLHRFELNQPEMLSVPVYQNLTKNAKTVRSVQEFNGKIYFAVDKIIFGFTPNPDGSVKPEPDIVYRGANAEITTFLIAANGKYLIAGTRDGDILRWQLETPQIALLLGKSENSIYMLKTVNIASIEHLLEGSKKAGVQAITVSQDVLDMKTIYENDVKIRWIAGSSDYIVGISSDLTCAYIWQTDDKKSVKWCIKPDNKIQDAEIWTT